MTTAPILKPFQKIHIALFYNLMTLEFVWVLLMQNGIFIVYASKKLKVHEKNCSNRDLELVSIVFDLKIWCHYLYSSHVDVFTDHKSLQYVFS